MYLAHGHGRKVLYPVMIFFEPTECSQVTGSDRMACQQFTVRQVQGKATVGIAMVRYVHDLFKIFHADSNAGGEHTDRMTLLVRMYYHFSTVFVHPGFGKARKGYAHISRYPGNQFFECIQGQDSSTSVYFFQQSLRTERTVNHASFFRNDCSDLHSGCWPVLPFLFGHDGLYRNYRQVLFGFTGHTVVNEHHERTVVFQEVIVPDVPFDIHIVYA